MILNHLNTRKHLKYWKNQNFKLNLTRIKMHLQQKLSLQMEN